MANKKIRKNKPRSARDVPDKYLHCLAFTNHHWKRWTPPQGMFRPKIGVKLVQRCHCGAIRHRNVTRATGEYLDAQWQYRLPNDYGLPEDCDRQDMRKEYVRREEPTKPDKKPAKKVAKKRHLHVA